VLTDEQVDRLRAGAGTALRESSEFKRLLVDYATPPPPPRIMSPGFAR